LLSTISKNLKVLFNLIILFFSVVYSSYCQDTVKIVTYNLLRFDGDTDRNIYYKKVVDELAADIYITQELSNSSGVSNFLNNILNHGGQDKFLSAKFYDDHDIDQALFFNKDKFEIISTSKVIGEPRDIMVYRLKHFETDKLFYIFNMHLKASPGSTNEIRREAQVISLMDYTKQMNNAHFYIAAGDFNIYTTDEPAYRKFFEETSTGYGNFNDLITVDGKYNNEEFSAIHTQSPRTSQFGGGASGGLDDRFDYILFSDSLVMSKKTFVIKDSYNVLGNDGNHYNMAINEMPNLSVSQDLADALHYASDHLPVSVKIIFSNDVVDPVNSPPLVSDTMFQVNEFSDDGIIIGKIIAEDPENDTLSFSILSGNDQNIFSIDQEGNITVEEGTLIDYDNKNFFLLVVQVSDGILKSNLQLIINVIESPPLSLEHKKNEIKLSPNPVNNLLYITFDNLDFSEFLILSLNGNVISSHKVTKKTHTINFSNKPDGIYFFHAVSPKNKPIIRIIKKGS
tara:strand:+ start:5196 stop:6728 length:1533 start_codon:yes stop_codon:yes gene_type:complete